MSGAVSTSIAVLGRPIRILATILLMSLGLRGFAQSSDAATLTFSDNKARVAWIQDGLPTIAPKQPSPVTGLTFELKTITKSKDETAYVWDQSSGLIASRKVSSFKNGLWDVKDSDFDTVADVKVSVQHDGKPVSAANLTLVDPARSQNQLLDPGANGVGEFFFVKPGAVKVTVQYRTRTGMATPVTQEFQVSKTAASPEPVFTISLPEDTGTVSSGPAPAANSPASATAVTPANSAPAAPANPTVQSNPLGSFVVVIVALGVVLALGYALLQYMKNNPETVLQKLEQMGAQIPKPGDEDLTQGVPAVPLAAPAPPAPVQKIMLDPISEPYSPASPQQDPYVMMSGSPSSVPPMGAPRLKSASGDAIPIPDEPMVVGRDAGLGLSLVGESSVSRRHAEISKRPEGVVLRDLGSTNGTYVNGSRLQGEAVLRPGDDVRFGAVGFRFEG